MDCFALLAMTAHKSSKETVKTMRERRAIPGYSFTRVRSTNTKCTRGRGCNGHPAFPTPSLGEGFINGSGASRGEDANACLELTSLQATSWVVNLRREQLLTFG